MKISKAIQVRGYANLFVNAGTEFLNAIKSIEEDYWAELTQTQTESYL